MTQSAPGNRQQETHIGELLIREGVINETQLKQALAIQKKERETEFHLEQILVRKGYLSQDQMDILKSHPDRRKKLGQMIVEHEIMAPDHVKEALVTKADNQPIGQALLQKGLISKEMLNELVEMQNEALEIGELAVRLQMMREIDLVRALSYMNNRRTLGEILCSKGFIQPEDLSMALKKHNMRSKIGEILINQGMISKKEFQAALKEQGRSREKIGEFLINKGLITHHQLYNALSHQYNTPYKTLDDFYYDELVKVRLIKFVSEKYGRRNMILPISMDARKLVLGITYPEGFKAVDELQLIYRNLKLKTVFINEKKFRSLFSVLYNSDLVATDEKPGPAETVTAGAQSFSLDHIKAIKEGGPKQAVYSGTESEIKHIVDTIINYGIVHGASDIHFEQDRKGVKLRYRIDGICQEPKEQWLKDHLATKPEAVISRIKVMSNLDISERRMPQDGVFRITYRENNNTFDLDFRVAVCPAIVGENITIRILDSRRTGLGIDNLNHSRHVLDPLKQLFKSSAGMVLVSGPTGSGKSSTLYAALQYVNSPEIKIITAEDPIEYSFPGIMQTQTNTKIGLSFARLLRSFLRLDPDVILVGEVRDQETAVISFDAAQTGHLLLSTIHTNDSINVVSRLIDLGIDHNQIASSLIGVVSQRLVRRNCAKCSRQVTPPKEEWQLFFSEYPSHIKFYKGIGCKACDFTGFDGRTLVSELFELNRTITLAISCKTTETELKRLAIKSGMKTMADDGMMKMNQICLSELIRVLPLEMINEFKIRNSGPKE
ncbi:MAG: Flp pilus assembly complex ATPase component TadA [Desulfobacter sp.]|nr:MAG: Flp pilus assembly complex ATPase component TadA [Desulfobacter sp.]